MIDERRKFARRKVMLTLLHIIFAAMAVFGISAMYLNSNYGKGIKWIYEDAYEDSSQQRILTVFSLMWDTKICLRQMASWIWTG